MPMCGFNKKMIQGIAIFCEGLFEATLERAKQQNIGVEEAFRNEIRELGLFLEALEEKYQELRTQYTPAETMRKIADWIDKGK